MKNIYNIRLFIHYRFIAKQHTNICLTLTHISLMSFLWDISKQCIQRSDAAQCGVLSGSPLFAYRMFY